jgi:UDP-N-acetylmuramoyl-L-alanyl-D-glutamate--2,6-diaminopimelate ligase
MSELSLRQLLDGIADPAGNGDIRVSGLVTDSREARPGDAFIALRGAHSDGLAFAAGAVEQGARVVLAEAPLADAGAVGAQLDVPVLGIEQLPQQLGELAARLNNHPSRALRVVGVTGTNGKTSIVQLLAQALERLGHRTASIGTLGMGLHGHLRESGFTTPGAIAVQGALASFREQGASHVAMEVSSHALEQGRVNGVDFELAAFTNLTRDHLDYHGSMEAYGAAKAKLFVWPGLRAAVINSDDAFGRELLARLPTGVQVLRISIADGREAEVAASNIVTSAEGLRFDLRTPWGTRSMHSPLLGRFNVANLLTVIACLGALGESFERIVEVVSTLQPVNGRMNRLGGTGALPLAVVDYAHTPDALEQALTALRAHCAGRLICVFGCGGERDAGKRPLMGAIAERLADVVIVTDDNPRGEDGDAIVAQIVAGLRDPARVAIERDRGVAIRQALEMADAGDVVLIAGKGHETYQDGAHGRRPFDDLAVARAALERRQPNPRASEQRA